MSIKFFSQKSDTELISDYRENGNEQAFEEIVNRYIPLVFVICSKYLNEEDSRDASFEIFEKLIFLLKQHDIANFRSWLHVVAKNHCLMLKRQSDRKGLYLIDPCEFEHIAAEDDRKENSRYTDLKSNPEKISAAVNQLKEPQRLCIQYFYYLEKSYKEISKLTGFNLK
jgi:RNA polymerase sigma-70 factor (ECF subfamily)